VRARGAAAVRPFDFVAPASVDETLRLLGDHGPGASLLAGGQSYLILLRQGLVAPELLIGLKGVGELAGVELPDGRLRLGSMVTYHRAATDPEVAARVPVLAAAAGSVGSVHIRNLGTVGGSLCHADPAGDVPTVLLTLDATVGTLAPGGRAATYRADDFFRGLFETRLEDDELLAWIDLPGQPDGATFGYRRFSFRQGEYPMAVAACRLGWEGGRCTGPRVAVGGGGEHPARLPELERLLEGASADEVVAAAASDAPYAGLRPAADVRGGQRWKRRVVASLVRDTVAEAVGARS
jgi:carbon-monoxide dehydrogenase medium subunit